MWPSSRTFTISASRYTIGYSSSSGRFCHCLTSSITASVTLEISVGETSILYISSRWPWISRVVMPRAYMEMILSSKPVHRVCPLATIFGSRARRGRLSPGLHGDDLVGEAGPPVLSLGHDLRFERRLPVPRRLQFQ